MIKSVLLQLKLYFSAAYPKIVSFSLQQGHEFALILVDIRVDSVPHKCNTAKPISFINTAKISVKYLFGYVFQHKKMPVKDWHF